MPFDRRKLHALALTLTSSIVLAAAAASPAYADGGRGGDGFSSGGSPAAGGAGGGEGANGQAGSGYVSQDADGGGGGGGGGAGGGIGGSGGSAMNNGGGAAGQDGASSTTYWFQGAGGGGGGNGGVHGGTLSGNQSNIGDRVGAAGGAAGNGGNTTNSGSMAGGGGGGGAGGYGLVMTGASGIVSLTSSGSATGGNGGSGGRGGTASGGSGRGGNGGSGGDGGLGINFTDTGSLTNRRTVLGGNGGTGGAGGNSSDYAGGNGGNGGAGGAGVRFDAASASLYNERGGLIQGGNGGTGGAGGTGNGAGSTGFGGVGGAGVIGAGLSIINGGSIVGGLGADGTRADAITFTGGNNYLRLLETSSLTGNIGITAAGSVVSFDHRSDLTLANVITGLGGISMATFAEKLTLTGDNTYTGGTTINSGRVLQIGAGGTTGSILGNVANSGTLIFDRSDAVTFGGVISGTGTVTKSGGGTLTLTSDHTYSGGTTISAGTLQIGNGGTTGSITGDVANNGTLVFHRSDAVTFDGAISGTGGVTKNGGNTLTLTGANTYAGTTSVMSGTLRQGAAGAFSANSNYLLYGFTTLDIGNTDTAIGGLSGSGRVELGGHVLTVGANNGGSSFAGTLANGDLVKIGSGEFSLDGRASNLASVRVDGGTLSTGSEETASTRFTVNAGAKLSGYGTVGATTINGGTLAPGSGPATLTVQGNLSFTAASSYRIEVTPQESGRVNVSGTAALSGAAVNAVFLPAGQTKRAAPGTDVYVAKQYTILNATGGLDGKFGSLVNTDLPSGFKSSLSYGANNVYLDLELAFGVPGGLNGNAGAVGDALVNYFNRTGGIPVAFGMLDAKSLSQISGETTTGSQQTSVDASNMFLTQMTDPFAAGRGEAAPGALPYADDAMAYAGKRAPTDAFASMHRKAPVATLQERWNVWAAGFGGSQTTDGNTATGSNNSKSSVYGMAVGADYWFSPFTVAGLSMAGGGTNFSVNGGGTGRSDLFQLGGFIRHNVGSIYISAAAAYGWQDITTDRTVTVAGVDQLRANFNANSYAGRVEVGNRFATPWIGGLGLTPYAAFQVTAFDLPAYAESVVAGSNTFALTYAGKTALAPRSELGLRTDKSFAMNDAILTLRGRAAWAHDTNRDRSASATFQSLPGASFIVDGASLAKHTALTSASAELKWMNGWSVAGTFEGEFSDVTRSYAGKGVVRYAW